MNFLKENDNKYTRKIFQLKGYVATPQLQQATDSLDVENFELPEVVNQNELIEALHLPENLRFGNQQEYYFASVLNQSLRYEILFQNTQIIQDKKTLGELDFIVKDLEKNELLHIEIANKFYLYNPLINEENKRWIGPNKKDSLHNKITKFKEKQLPLLYQEFTRKTLQLFMIDSRNVKQKICFKAQLFLPFEFRKKLRLEKLIKENISGVYLSITRFMQKDFEAFSYFIPEKKDWFVDPKFCEHWFAHQEILGTIQMHLALKKSPLIWQKKTDNSFEKLFVVWW